MAGPNGDAYRLGSQLNIVGRWKDEAPSSPTSRPACIFDTSCDALQEESSYAPGPQEQNKEEGEHTPLCGSGT